MGSIAKGKILKNQHNEKTGKVVNMFSLNSHWLVAGSSEPIRKKLCSCIFRIFVIWNYTKVQSDLFSFVLAFSTQNFRDIKIRSYRVTKILQFFFYVRTFFSKYIGIEIPTSQKFDFLKWNSQFIGLTFWFKNR